MTLNDSTESHNAEYGILFKVILCVIMLHTVMLSVSASLQKVYWLSKDEKMSEEFWMQKLTKAVITPLQGMHSLRMIVHFVILTQPSFGKISSCRHCSNSKCLWIANAFIKMLTTHTHTHIYIYVCVCVCVQFACKSGKPKSCCLDFMFIKLWYILCAYR
jgi:hypothetical protein